jgi:hypothetical protein
VHRHFQVGERQAREYMQSAITSKQNGIVTPKHSFAEFKRTSMGRNVPTTLRLGRKRQKADVITAPAGMLDRRALPAASGAAGVLP